MDIQINETTIAAVCLGFALDAVLGDPQNPYHPVRIIGWVISKFLKLFKKLKINNNSAKFLYGVFMTVCTVGASYLSVFAIVKAMYALNVWAGIAVEGIGCYFMIGAKSLACEGLGIAKILEQDDLVAARKRLSYIVGRDTENLNREKIIKAAVETVSENLSDGVVGPLFFMVLGGAPLGFAYKAINTLDSTVGYTDQTYLYLGKFAARTDDVVNLIPSRLSAAFMMISAMLLKKDWKNSIKIYSRDRYNHKSPNSAQTESCCAGALGIELGGDSTYGGKVVPKQTIGEKQHEADIGDLKDSVKLMYLSSVLFLLGAVMFVCWWR